MNLMTLLNICINIITTIIICYAITANIGSNFKNRLKYTLITILFANTTSYIFTYILTSLVQFSFIIQIVIFALVGCFVYKKQKKELIISTILSLLGCFFIEIIVANIWTKLYKSDYIIQNVYDIRNILSPIFSLLIWIFVAFIVYIAIYYAFNYFKKRNISKYLIFAVVFPMTQMLILLYSYNIIINLKGNIKFLSGLAILSIISIISDAVLFSILKYLYNKDLIDQKNKLMEKELELEKNYYNKIIGDIEKTNKIKHDIKNQLQSIYVLLEKKEFEAVNELLTEINNKIVDTEPVFCSNRIVESIMLEKKKECEKEKIKLHSNINLNDKLKIEKIDLCSLFSNIMDNAIKASTLIKNSNIDISAKISGGYIVICEKNNKVDERSKVNKKSNSYIKKHGLGLEIIKDIVNKYNGNIEIENNKNTFKINIWLKNS